MLYETIIIGGGPAGTAAGIYAGRKKLKTLVLTDSFGGQSVVSPEIHNWLGVKAISGEELAKNLKEHLLAYQGEDLTVKEGIAGIKVEKSGDNFVVTDSNNEKYESKTVFIAVGSKRKKLAVPGATEYDQKGLTYCASCDGPLFADQDVAVIGGGNAAFETAGQLLAYTKSVTLLHHGEDFKADKITVEKLLKNPRFHALTNSETISIKGEKFVTGLTYKNLKTNEEKELAVTGIFVEIGFAPNTKLVEGLVDLNNYGAIVVNPKNQATNIPGIWAAGDCTDGLYHQNNIAAGEAVTAIEDLYNFLKLH